MRAFRPVYLALMFAVDGCSSGSFTHSAVPGTAERSALASLATPASPQTVWILNGGGTHFASLLAYSRYGFPKVPAIVGPTDPTGIAVDSNGKIYLVNSAPKIISTYTASGVPTNPTIHLRSRPQAIAVDSNGQIYVTESDKTYQCEPAVAGTLQNCGDLLRFNADGTFAGPTITGLNGNSGPTAVAVDSSGKIYIATVWDCGTGLHCGRVTTYLPNGTRSTPTITGLKKPTGITVDSQGKIRVVDSDAGLLQTFNADGTATSPTISLARFDGLALAGDANGKVYVTTVSSRTLRSFNPDGSPGSPSVDNIVFPHGVALGPLGKIFITISGDSAGTNSVAAYSQTGTRVPPMLSNGFNYPRGLAIDSSGKLYVANELNSTIRTFNPDGTLSHPTIGSVDGLNNPVGVAVDSTGKIFVANYGNMNITSYRANGNNVQAIRTSPTISLAEPPQDVAVDAAGKVYVVSATSSRITTYSPEGWHSRPTITANLSSPTSLWVDGSGKIYVTNLHRVGGCRFDCGTLTTYNWDGTPASPTITGLSDPFGVTVDAAGMIYVAEGYTFGFIGVYNPDGSRARVGFSGDLFPIAIAIH